MPSFLLMPLMPLMLAATSYATLVVPRIPDLSTDPGVVHVVDVIRVVMLIIGLASSALTVRHAHVIPRANGYSAAFVEGFRWRCWALAVALIYVSVANYQRIGQPVTASFVLGLVFLLVALRSVHTAATLPRQGLMFEEHLAAYEVPCVTPQMAATAPSTPPPTHGSP